MFTKPCTSETPSEAVPLDGFDELLAVLPVWVQDAVQGVPALEEICIDLGRALTIKHAGGHRVIDRLVEKDDLHYLVHRTGGFREDNRTGIERTVHRISAIRDRYGEIVGITVRIGRFIQGVAEPLRGALIDSGRSVMLLGPPGSGKTTLLRDVVRLIAEQLGPRVVVVDSSNEIGGDGKVPHPGLGLARRLQVPTPTVQASVMMQALANHGPEVIVADEIGYHDDVAVVLTMARRGVQVIATAHGESLHDVIENPDLAPLLGGIDLQAAKRHSRPVFRSLLEVRGKGQLYYHANLADAVDDVLTGKEASGVWLVGGQHDAREGQLR